MRVTIVDLDWYNHMSHIPNITCMQLSSYYKQLGYIVNFPTKTFELMAECDEMFVVRDSLLGSTPPEIPILDPKVHLVGKFYRFYKNRYEVPDAVLGCRPDYRLYELPIDNRAANNNMARMFNSYGDIIEVQQDFHTAYDKAKDTIITDDDFWDHPYDDLVKCLKKVRTDKNISFLKPIDINAFIEDERKIELFKTVRMKPRGCSFKGTATVAESLKAFQVIGKLAEGFALLPYKPMEFQMYNSSKEDIDNIEDALHFAVMAKHYGVHIILLAPDRKDCALWNYYENIEEWTRRNFTRSLVWYFASIQSYVSHLAPEVILNDEIHWSIAQMQDLADIIRRRCRLIEDCGFVAWKDVDDPFVDLRKTLRIH